MQSKKIKYTLIAILTFCFFYFFFTLRMERAEFVSFSTLEWELQEDCNQDEVSKVDWASSVLKMGTGISCKTKSFILSSPVTKIQYSIPTNASGGYVLRISNDSGFVKDIDLKVGRRDIPNWYTTYVELPVIESPDAYVFEFIGNGLEVRNRVEFLTSSPAPLLMTVKGNFKPTLYQTIPVTLFLFLLVLFLGSSKSISSLCFFTVLFIGSFVMFYSGKLYFHFDEWHVLQRFSEIGFAGVWYSHNEHFLPLFFAWYYLLAILGGDSFSFLLVISFLLHALHGLVIYFLLKEFSFSEYLSRFFVFLYSVAAVNAEVLEWLFEQCIILSSISGLCSIIFLRRFISKGYFSDLLLFSLCIFAAPLLFGNGFTWLPFGFCVVALHSFMFENKFFIKRLLRFLYAGGMGVLASVPTVLMYLSNTKGSSSSSMSSQLYDNIPEILSYMMVGSGVGSIFRGLGLYPHLGLSSLMEGVREFYPKLAASLGSIAFYDFSFELSLAIIVHVFLLALFVVLGVFLRSKVIYFGYLFGVLCFFFALILPAIARFKLGELQSLALRYQYQGLLGLLVMLLAIFQVVLFSKSHQAKIIGPFFQKIGYGIIFIWLFIQVNLVTSSNYARYNGDINRPYVVALADWKEKALSSEEKPYEGSDSTRGLFPLHHPTITPGTHPKDILKTYLWLQGK